MAVIICPGCSTRYRMKDSQISKASKMRCKKCETVFSIQENIEDQGSGGGTSQQEAPPPLPMESSQPSESSPDAHRLDFDLSSSVESHSQEEESQETEEEKASEPPSDEHSLDFDLSGFQPQNGDEERKEEKEEEEETAPENLLSFDMDGGGLSLDFQSSSSKEEEQSPEEAAPEMDFSFHAAMPEEQETDEEEEEEELQDHVTAPSFESEQGGMDLAGLSLEGGSEEESSSEGAPSLDFSFSAVVPEGEDEEEEDLDEEDLDEEDMGEEEEELMVSEPEEEEEEPLLDEEEEYEDEEFEDEDYEEEEDLDTCCIDSLAMGLDQCEICGRDLRGKDRGVALELQRQRREQLKDTLIKSETQISFKELQQEAETTPSEEKTPEDFSDVERALDALADGTFHETIKKQESRKAAAKTMKLAGIAVVVVVLIAGGGLWSLLPSQHEKLMARYEQLTAAKEINAKDLATLFLDAAIARDQQLLNQISVMKNIPEITEARVVGTGDEYEETSLGMLGKDISTLKQEIASLEKRIEEKTTLLNEYNSKNLSSSIVQQKIDSTIRKIDTLQAEFDERNEELKDKLVRLRQELDDIRADIEKNKATQRKYMTAVDTVGKALYKNSVSKQKYLEEKKEKIELQLIDEEASYKKAYQELEEEFRPRFTELEERLASQRRMLEEAKLLEDEEKSPVTVLSQELEHLSKDMLDKKKLLEKKEQEYKETLNFFTDEAQRRQIAKQKKKAEFRHISRNVAAVVSIDGRAETPITVTLKRYQASVGDQVFQGDWLVEKFAQ